MPELPEVETHRRKLEKKLKGKKIINVTPSPDRIVLGPTSSASVKKAFLGKRIKKFGRKGKYLWMEISQSPVAVFHLGMTGSFLVTNEIPEKVKSIKLVLEFEDGSYFVFKDPRRFGRMFLLKDLDSPPLSKLGADVLTDPLPLKSLRQLLAGRSAPIKSLLLDQSLFAGVGNWMADEILFQARINPKRRAKTLTGKEATALHRKLLSVTKLAVKLKADYDRFPKNWLFHHRWGRKSGHVSTGESIRRTTVGGRSTAWVPELQL